MYQCPNCKNPIEYNMSVCPNCGYSFSNNNESNFSNNMPPNMPPYPPVQPKPVNNGFAIASMVLGIISIPLSCCCYIGAIPAILAIIFGFIARNQISESFGAQTGDGMALAGIIMGFCTIGILIVLLILSINNNTSTEFWKNFYKGLEEGFNDYDF